LLKYFKKHKKVEQYSKFALVYDHMMKHIDYERWAKFIDSILKMNGVKFGDIIDISCGTGTFLIKFNKYGYKLYGSDNSLEMINQAKLKCNKIGINFYIMDMRNLNFEKRFDGVVSLFDSINYLTAEKDLLKNFCSVESILNDNGIFIFDACTETNSIKNFNQYTESGENKGIYYYRKSYYVKEEHVQINDIKIVNKNNGENYREIHRQRIYTPQEIKEIINNSPLKLINMYDDFSFDPPDEETERIHFVLKKR